MINKSLIFVACRRCYPVSYGGRNPAFFSLFTYCTCEIHICTSFYSNTEKLIQNLNIVCQRTELETPLETNEGH